MSSTVGLLLLATRMNTRHTRWHYLWHLACSDSSLVMASARQHSRSLTKGAASISSGKKKDKLLCSYSFRPVGTVKLLSNENCITTKKSEVELNLAELKMKLERLGRLNQRDVSQAVKSLEQCAEELSDSDCLRLLQFCKKMVEDEYRPCANLVERVWWLTTSRPNGQITLDHVELYLHLSLVTESTNFSEKSIFDLGERHKIKPNPHMFEMLIMNLGQRGHLDGATRVLTMMKQLDIPLREITFAALILAYRADGDWEGVQSVLDAMRSIQITLTSVTYGAMITVCGVSGQMARMKQVVAQMKLEGVILSPGQLESVLLSLVRSGQAGEQFENMNFVVSLMDESGVKMDLSRVILKMIYSQRAKEAVHLMPTLPLIYTNNHLYSNASIYVREMVHARLDPDLIVELCHELHQKEINPYALLVALEYALKERWETLAWVLLKAMKEKGIPLREHYFWPLFHMNAIGNTPTQLLGCIHEMTELGQTPGFETLRDHVIPGLSLSQPLLTIKMLQNAGLTATMVATPMLVVLVKNNMMDQAIKFVQETKTPLSLGDVIGTLASAWHSSPKAITSLLALLIRRRKRLGDENEDWGGQFLLNMSATRVGLSVHEIHPLFQEFRKHKIFISEHSADLLVSKCSKPIQESIKGNLSLILDPSLGPPPKEQEYNILPHPRSMSGEELEGHLVELQTKGLNTRGTLRRLLLHHAAKNNTTAVLSLMQKASEEGVRPSAGILASVLMAYVTNGNDEAATSMLSFLQEEHPSFTVDSYKMVDLCTLLMQKDRSLEAVTILQRYLEENVKQSVDPKQIRRNCRNLLMASANTCSYKETRELFDLLHSGGLVDPDTLILGTLVKSKLNGRDLRGAVEELKRILETYKCLPMRREVLIHLIHNHHGNNANNNSASSHLLEDMLNLIAKVNGSLLAHHELLFAYLEADRPAEAGKVLQNLKMIDKNHITRQLQYYVKTEREEPLKHLLTASRGNDAIDRERLYSSLLSIYYVQGEGEKGLSLWTMIQEENLTPSPAFLSTLAALLATCNMKIPFQV